MFRFRKGYFISILPLVTYKLDTGQNEYILFGVGNKFRFYAIIIVLDFGGWERNSEQKLSPHDNLCLERTSYIESPFPCSLTTGFMRKPLETLHFSEEPSTCFFPNHRYGSIGLLIVLYMSEAIFNGGRGEMYGKRTDAFFSPP